MRVRKNLSGDLENIQRFLDVLGNGLIALSGKQLVRPEFFLMAHEFIQKNILSVFFKKEEILARVLTENGFAEEDGPVGALKEGRRKSGEAADVLLKAARLWQVGDEESRADVIWAASEFNTVTRQHLERLKNLIFPLLEQTIPVDDEHKISEEMSQIAAAAGADYALWGGQINKLEEELSDWL